MRGSADMKNVNIYVRGICRSNIDKVGCYACMLEYNNHRKFIKQTLGETTTIRAILTGMIHSISILKEPCNITMHISGHVGLNKKKPKNKDLVDIFKSEIKKGGHKLTVFVDRKYQEELSHITKSEIPCIHSKM